MTHLHLNLTEQLSPHKRLLSDYIRSANALDPVLNADGSTTVYLEVHQHERFSTLPRSRRRRRFARLFGARRVSTTDTDALGVAANVRKIPRRRAELS